MDDDHYAAQEESHRLSFGEMSNEGGAVDEGDSGSHHENEDDVFSDHSPRSSMGSMSEGEHLKHSHGTRSPRISDIQQYESEVDFVPTVKGTPRPPFRSPSSVKAMQMSSPTPSVMGTPRSGRRSALPTVSRLGSPSLSAQYSPKKTPPRFKRNTPPLVLLHVTLLPLRWTWGDVLDSAQTSELSEEAKTLREAWRQLQDRNGDTIQDRGILLPHPQNDFEMLEERLLEALELPFKSRARILECGHYLGPSNEMSFADEAESEDEDAYDDNKSTRAGVDKETHWCGTCHTDIRYDALGAGKIYRVKVYASNGLLRAGAWEACWKEMERVDVELEPIIDSKVQDELAQLAAEQDKVMHDQDRSMHMQEPEEKDIDEDLDDDPIEEPAEEPMEEDELDIDESMHEEEPLQEEEHIQEESIHEEESPLEEESFMEDQHDTTSPPQPDMPYDSAPSEEERRRMSEERYRNTYGDTASQHARASMGGRSSAGFVPQDVPPQPSPEGFEQHKEPQQGIKNATLPELLSETFRVLMQDKKNIMIALLSVLTLMVAVRGGGGGGGGGNYPRHENIAFQTVVRAQETTTTTVTQAQAVTVEAEAAPVVTTTSTVVQIRYTPAVKIEPEDPCAAVEPHTVEKVKWLTETVTQTERSTITQTEAKPTESEGSLEEDSLEEGPVEESEQIPQEEALVVQDVTSDGTEAEVNAEADVEADVETEVVTEEEVDKEVDTEADAVVDAEVEAEVEEPEVGEAEVERDEL